MPGSTATGLLLHEILEKVPFESIKAGQSPEEWAALEEVSRVVKEAIAHHSVKLDDHNRGQVMPMIHGDLTMSVPTEAGKSIPGFYKCQNHLREMEFLFPYPEVMHPSLAAEKRPRKLVIERGFIKGYIDLVVEHDGLVFLVDWKSDVLASYEPEPIQQHVADHYDLQLKLYTLALLKALRIGSGTDYEARFGGMIYIFLRGLVPADDKRPTSTSSAEMAPDPFVRTGHQERRTSATECASMKNQIELSPLGTASGFVTVPNTRRIDPDNVLLTWLKKIRERLNDLYNIDDVVALMAWELARWQSGLTPLERQAVILLVLLMLVQDRQGSTRVALRRRAR